nr:enoyl-ACP reductase [Gammaproteobacteria bacterium]
MGLLNGKQALIVGVASNRSIAWAIAEAMRKEGAELAFAYQNERLGARVRALAMEAESSLTFPCDVAKDEEIDTLFSALEKHWRHLDIIVHSVAFAPSEQLKGDYLDAVTREGFRTSHDISSYSFTALAKRGRAMMRGRQGALLTLTYLGAIRALPNYNVMGPAKASLEANVRYMARALGAEGIRVNAVSAGPIKTLAAAAIGDFRRLMELVAENAPLQRNVTAEEVGNAAAFLCSDLASGITGEILYVDGGFNFSYGDPPPA